ncbi:unnamed protein product [Brachionus calyciflorus]|uniref:Uncharacterized protein n=1 Tax=Brachionus calyciflorus TaxID=104777 RepID=A0A813X7D0_9BILA|nr:unnamed protein product [Brachionus calyciflorus]
MESYQIYVFGLIFTQSINCIAIYGDFCDNCDLIGNDIQQISSTGLEDCWSRCLNNPNCNHFLFSKISYGCWLKNKANIDFSSMNVNNGAIAGIIKRSKNCTNANDFTPNPLNCTLYHRCLSGYLQNFGCLNNLFFDSVTKTCNLNSTCFYGCKNNMDTVGILSNEAVSNDYFNCATKSIEKCVVGFIFDLKEKKCINISCRVALGVSKISNVKW